jgi:hypothetical protein
MSKEKHEAWRSMREVSDRDARTMREMYMHSQEQRSNILLPLWNSERKRLVDGKWYIPLSEVSEALTGCCAEGCCDHNDNTFTSGMGAPIDCVAHIDDGTPEGKKITESGIIFNKPTPEEDSKRWLRNMVEIEPNDMELGGRVRAEYWKERNLD